jgi:transposase
LIKDEVHIMARTAQISKEKRQSIITLRHEGQSIQKMSRTLKASTSAVAKTIKHSDETGSHEDCHRKGRPRVTSAAEEKFISVTSLRNCSPINASQSSSNRRISTSTVQRRLHESGLPGRNCSKETITKRHQYEEET